MLAAIRPDGWNVALFVHVLGATVIVGSLVFALVALAAARGAQDATSLRLGYRVLLLGALPGYVVMRGGAEWIASKEHVADVPGGLAWVDIGYMVGDAGLLFLVAATVLSGLAVRRAAAAPADGRAPRVAAGLVALTLLGYVVAIWAMTTKPV